MEQNLEAIVEVTEKQIKQRLTNQMFHMATPSHSNKLRGVGITRKSKEQTKKAKKLGKSQRKVNHKMSNKKHHKTGSNKRK